MYTRVVLLTMTRNQYLMDSNNKHQLYIQKATTTTTSETAGATATTKKK